MTIKIPPPPQIANADPTLNRWLLELTSILNSQGSVDPNSVEGLPALSSQVTTNTANILALQHSSTGQGASIVALQAQVTALQASLASTNVTVNALAANPVVHSGATAPAGGLGSVNDWYTDTVAKHVYVKTGVATWTLIV